MKAMVLLLLGLLAAPAVLAALPGSDCSSVSPSGKCGCCEDGRDISSDSWCSANYASECDAPSPVVVGSTCGTVTPSDRCACCDGKPSWSNDDWCSTNYQKQCQAKPVGTSCGTVSPDSRCDCCKDRDIDADPWCSSNFADQCKPPKPVGTTCGTVSPDSRCDCCSNKKDMNDPWCADNFGQQCETQPPSPSNVKDFPYMAYIESRLGVCGGSLVAPGYILTAAQCVFQNGQALKAEELTVWVGGKWLSVETVHVHEDYAQFAEFDNPKSQPSWDIAMLALSSNSKAQYVALPASAVPANGDWITQTAWEEEAQYVDSAQITAWDGCPPGWADTFCAAGGGFLQYCPHDKGSPALMKVGGATVQVGLTSGPGCTGEADNWGYFVRLADKDVLRQLLVWMNSRAGTANDGLDATVQQWIEEANAYLDQP